MNEQAGRWFKQAWHDLTSAQRSLEIGLFDVALILCQQAVEKGLKGLYVAQRNELPPRIHSIERLADLTSMRPQLEQTLLELEDFYIRLRYPDFEGPLPYELADIDDATTGVQFTKDALQLIASAIATEPEEQTPDDSTEQT